MFKNLFGITGENSHMNIKKTDVFSGIGIFVLQNILNLAIYAYKQNQIYLMLGIIATVVITIVIVFILVLLRNRKDQIKQIESLTEENNEYKNENDILNATIQDLDGVKNELELYANKFQLLLPLDDATKKIIYLLKNGKKISKEEIQTAIGQIENIFYNDALIKNVKINTSVFGRNKDGYYVILYSTKHSLGTKEKLKLDEKSFVASACKSNNYMYCGDISNRNPETYFIELSGKRTYNSILAIPIVVDDETEYALVITSTKIDGLDGTYNKYRDVIRKHIDLLAIMIYLASEEDNND